MVKRLVKDKIPFCSTLGNGVPLAVKVALNNEQPVDGYIIEIEKTARYFASRELDPYQTFIEADIHYELDTVGSRAITSK